MTNEYGEAISSGWNVTVSDVSTVSVLRKRVGRAATSMNVIGVISASYSFAYLTWGGAWAIVAGLALGILVIWCCVRLSKRLRAGEPWAATLVAIWWLMWVVLLLVDSVPKLVSNYQNWSLFTTIGTAIFVLPVYFIARGLIALRKSVRAEHGLRVNASVLSNPWENETEETNKHAAFVNKRRLSVYIFLLLVPVPYLFFQLSGVTRSMSAPATNNTDVVFLIAYEVGVLVGLIPILAMLALTAFLYRRARRRALLPAAELSKRNPRPIVLYLRSFRDEALKMRARATNGRTTLERVVRVTFEEVVTDHLWRTGPVVAIGKPGDKLPPLGAARDYVSGDGWQQKVEEMMLSASVIVVVVGRTEGLAWEFAKIIELGLMPKLILLFPPLPSVSVGTTVAELPGRWNALREQARGAGLELPENVDFYRTKAVLFPAPHLAHMILSYGVSDWTYETVLDAATKSIGQAGCGPQEKLATGPLTNPHRLEYCGGGKSTRSIIKRNVEYVVVAVTMLAWALGVLAPLAGV